MHPKPRLLLLAVSFSICSLWGQQAVVKPEAFVKIDEQNYCFARPRALEVERMPQSTLVLRLRLQLAYRNTGPRPLIIPIQHDQSAYTALKPGVMTKQKGVFRSPLAPKIDLMKHLPPDVSPDNPVDPPNDVFSIIPAGGVLNYPIHEEVQLTIYHKSDLHSQDLRGHRVYLRLELEQQPISPDLKAKLSDMWTRIGVPWTGKLRTNTLAIDVPAEPDAKGLCVDKKDEGPKPQYTPLQPPK